MWKLFGITSIEINIVFDHMSALNHRRIGASNFEGVFAVLPKTTISFIMSARPSARMVQLGSHWTDFHEIRHFCISRNAVKNFQVSLKIDNNNGKFT